MSQLMTAGGKFPFAQVLLALETPITRLGPVRPTESGAPELNYSTPWIQNKEDDYSNCGNVWKNKQI